MVSVRPGAGKRAQVDYLLNSQEFTHMIMLDADAALIRHQAQMWAIDIYIAVFLQVFMSWPTLSGTGYCFDMFSILECDYPGSIHVPRFLLKSGRALQFSSRSTSWVASRSRCSSRTWMSSWPTRSAVDCGAGVLKESESNKAMLRPQQYINIYIYIIVISSYI